MTEIKIIASQKYFETHVLFQIWMLSLFAVLLLGAQESHRMSKVSKLKVKLV